LTNDFGFIQFLKGIGPNLHIGHEDLVGL